MRNLDTRLRAVEEDVRRIVQQIDCDCRCHKPGRQSRLREVRDDEDGAEYRPCCPCAGPSVLVVYEDAGSIRART